MLIFKLVHTILTYIYNTVVIFKLELCMISLSLKLVSSYEKQNRNIGEVGFHYSINTLLTVVELQNTYKPQSKYNKQKS